MLDADFDYHREGIQTNLVGESSEFLKISVTEIISMY